MDNTLDLIRAALEAERLRWLLAVRRFGVQVGLMMVGLVFLCAGLTMAHISSLAAIEPHVGAIWATAILSGVDVTIAVALGLAAMRLGPGAGERGAMAVRKIVRDELVRRIGVLRLLVRLAGAFRR